MNELKKNPIALYVVVLVGSIIIDTILGLFMDYSMFDFWTQFFMGAMIAGIGMGIGYWVLRVLEMNGVQLGHEETPLVLIRSGPYAFTRNPLYVAMTIIYVGVAILFDAPIAILALVPLLYHMKKVIVPAEETVLAQAFGAEYESYKLKVKRWI